ncbi:MAG: hypothetical protein SynsKO_13850 [Synoicihabitans sp.]
MINIRLITPLLLLWLIAGFVFAQGATPIPTVLAQRGQLIVDDDGSAARGGKTTHVFLNGTKLRAGAGAWARAPANNTVWRSTWSDEMGHIPVVSYQGFEAKSLIAEVTFRYGPISHLGENQTFRIALDNRPAIVGHIVSAWANPNNDFIESGFLLQHIRKQPDKTLIEDLLLDHQPLTIAPETWYTAILEVVGDEAFFRMGDHVAYAQSPEITRPKNLVSLTFGTTWHEVKRVRIWEATAHPEWAANKADALASRQPFAPTPHDYTAPPPVKSANILIAAHRGGYETDKADRAPENSVANIHVSQRKGYALYETDIQRTADGHFVIVHDPTIERELTGIGRASDLTLAELKQMSKKYRDGTVSSHRVATLDEFLREGKNRTIFKADLKPGVSAHFPAIMQLVNKLDARDSIIFRVPYRDADLFAQYHRDGVFTSPAQLMFMVSSKAQIDDVRARFNPQWIQVDLAKTNPATPAALDLIRYATDHGLKVETHAEGNSDDWAKLVRAGVRMFHTNRPAAMRVFLGSP